MARRTVSVLTATRQAVAAASHLTSMDAGAVETLPGPRRFAGLREAAALIQNPSKTHRLRLPQPDNYERRILLHVAAKSAA